MALFVVNIMQRNIIAKESKMQMIIKNLHTIVQLVIAKLKQSASRNDVMAYFEAEYKHDAKSAYQYWISTNNMNYSR
jgi:hypothetical protein